MPNLPQSPAPDRRRVLAGLAVAGGIAAPVVRRAHAQAGETVRISLSTPGSAGAIWRPLAAEAPAEETAGLALQWVGADPGQMQVQLMAGAIDVGSFGAVGLATSLSKGSDLVLFGPSLNNHGRWIVRADSPYHTPHDLIGKTIATQPKTTETYNQALIAASLAGLDLARQFNIVFGPPAANVALFERGDVEAVIALEPTATRLVGRGARQIARVGDMWQAGTGATEPPFLVGLAATRRWVDGHRETATRLARLFAAMNRRLHDHPDLFVTHSREMGFKPDEEAAIRLLPERLPEAYATRWDASVWAAIDRQVEIAVQTGALRARPAQALSDGHALAT